MEDWIYSGALRADRTHGACVQPRRRVATARPVMESRRLHAQRRRESEGHRRLKTHPHVPMFPRHRFPFSLLIVSASALVLGTSSILALEIKLPPETAQYAQSPL